MDVTSEGRKSSVMNAEERSEPKDAPAADDAAVVVAAEDAGEPRSPVRQAPVPRGGLSRKLTSLFRKASEAGGPGKSKQVGSSVNEPVDPVERNISPGAPELPELLPVNTAHGGPSPAELAAASKGAAEETPPEVPKKLKTVETPTGEATLLAETATVSPLKEPELPSALLGPSDSKAVQDAAAFAATAAVAASANTITTAAAQAAAESGKI